MRGNEGPTKAFASQGVAAKNADAKTITKEKCSKASEKRLGFTESDYRPDSRLTYEHFSQEVSLASLVKA